MKHRIVVIPGDGIGPEVISSAMLVLEASGADIEWVEEQAGGATLERFGTPLPEPVLETIREVGVALKGPITTPVGEGFSSVNVSLRKQLTLYANVRPVNSRFGVSDKFSDVDMVIFRENTEDVYAGLEQDIAPGVAQCLKIITKEASDRIANFAFDYAVKNGRRKVQAVHKANIMKKSDGLFLRSCRSVADRYPEVEYGEIIVDNCAMQMVIRPQQFDVLVLTNLYGDILSDLGAGLVGGLGLVPGANIGDGLAVFEAAHGSAPDIAGKGSANPLAIILSAANMMKYLGEPAVAGRMEAAVMAILGQKEKLTRDLGGRSGTAEFTKHLIDIINA